MKIALVLILKYIWRLFAPFVVPFLLFFARPVDENLSNHDDTYQGERIPRYKLPDWLKWAETPDMHLPGGLYEPTVKSLYSWLRERMDEGKASYLTSWYWIGIRNAGHGIPWYLLGEPVSSKDESRDKVFTFGPFAVKYGYKVAQDWYKTLSDKGYVAIPRFSIRLKSNI